MTVPRPGLPERVTIYEVGPRDGLQNEQAVVPAAIKSEFISRLAGAGLEWIETTSFVHPRWVPQLADASEVLASLGESGRAHTRPVLVPNERGMDRAVEAGVRSIAIFGSATETFAQRNLALHFFADLRQFLQRFHVPRPFLIVKRVSVFLGSKVLYKLQFCNTDSIL